MGQYFSHQINNYLQKYYCTPCDSGEESMRITEVQEKLSKTLDYPTGRQVLAHGDKLNNDRHSILMYFKILNL